MLRLLQKGLETETLIGRRRGAEKPADETVTLLESKTESGRR